MRDFPAVQWLRLHASTAGAAGSTPGPGTRTLHAGQHSQKKKRRKKIVQKMIPKTLCFKQVPPKMIRNSNL